MGAMYVNKITSGIPQDGLYAWYEFEDDFTDSVGSNDMSGASGTTYVNGIVGKGMSTTFSSNGPYSGTFSPEFFSSTINSISLWFKPEFFGGAGLGILQEMQVSPYVRTFEIGLSNNVSDLFLFSITAFGTNSSYTITNGWTLNEWTNLILVCKSLTKMDIYINGSFYGTWTTAQNRGWSFGSSNRMAFCYGTPSSPSSGKLVGVLDQVAFYNKQLSTDEISQLYSNKVKTRQRVRL